MTATKYIFVYGKIIKAKELYKLIEGKIIPNDFDIYDWDDSNLELLKDFYYQLIPHDQLNGVDLCYIIGIPVLTLDQEQPTNLTTVFTPYFRGSVTTEFLPDVDIIYKYRISANKIGNELKNILLLHPKLYTIQNDCYCCN